MKKNITCFLFIIFISIIFIATEVKASDDNNVDVIANITSESQTVEQNKSVFVEMNIENIENVESITGYIASTTDSNKYITVELKSTTQGSWYYFDLPSTVVVGETYTMPKIEVLYKDGTKITGKVSGQITVIKGIESSNNDNTIAKNILPKAGKEMIMKTVFLLGMILIILFIKNRKYKDII